MVIAAMLLFLHQSNDILAFLYKILMVFITICKWAHGSAFIAWPSTLLFQFFINFTFFIIFSFLMKKSFVDYYDITWTFKFVLFEITLEQKFLSFWYQIWVVLWFSKIMMRWLLTQNQVIIFNLSKLDLDSFWTKMDWSV